MDFFFLFKKKIKKCCVFFGFFRFFGILFKVTKVTTKSYQGTYWTPKIAKNGPKQHNKLFFCPKELEVGLRSGPYLLVIVKVTQSKFRHCSSYSESSG